MIQVKDIWKEYRLGKINHGLLFKDIQSWWARLRGRPDPNTTLIASDDGRAAGDRFWALREISFEVERGEVLGVIGRNGAGKSTLLKILARITTPSRGLITAKGRVASLLEVGTGFHPELSGRENVFLNGAILGMSKAEIRAKFEEIVDFAGVSQFIDTPVKRYSSGMYVRLAFAVAAHLEPEILVVDEVLAVGDFEFQQKCLGKMSEVSKQGRTILFVSHNMEAIKNLCGRALWLDGGRIREQGMPADVVSSYVRAFSVEIRDQASVNFPEDLNKSFQFLSARVQNSQGVVSSVFSCDEPVVIDTVCVVRRPLQGMYTYLHVSTLDGAGVWDSDSHDEGENPAERLSPGTYRVRITIPARSLGHGSYAGYLSAADSISNLSFDTPGFAVTFHLSDDTTRRGNRRNGFFSTKMQWDVTLLNVSGSQVI